MFPSEHTPLETFFPRLQLLQHPARSRDRFPTPSTKSRLRPRNKHRPLPSRSPGVPGEPPRKVTEYSPRNAEHREAPCPAAPSSPTSGAPLSRNNKGPETRPGKRAQSRAGLRAPPRAGASGFRPPHPRSGGTPTPTERAAPETSLLRPSWGQGRTRKPPEERASCLRRLPKTAVTGALSVKWPERSTSLVPRARGVARTSPPRSQKLLT